MIDFMKIMSEVVCDYKDDQSIATFYKLDIKKDKEKIERIKKEAEIFFRL